MSVIVGNVAASVPREEILRRYPVLTDPDIDAALAYAAELTREGTVDLPLEIKVWSLKQTWDDLHVAYFSSYALWNYLTIPFVYTYPGFVTEELALCQKTVRNGGRWKWSFLIF